MNFSDVIMNSARMRIIQYLLVHTQATVGEMRTQLGDIPPASLYRHIRILTDANCLRVTETRPVRGTVEKVYTLNPEPMSQASQTDCAALIQSSFLYLMHSFQTYFIKPDANAQRDLLGFSTSTLMLSDEEFVVFTQKLGAIFREVLDNAPMPGRRPRRLSIISSPCEDDENKAASSVAEDGE